MEKVTKQLLDWYHINKRDLPWRHTMNPYYIWISEIMLQQTRVEAVKEYYVRFIDRLPTLYDLATIEEDVLLKLWEGLGYYSRVRNMQKTAKILIEKGYKNLPNTRDELLSLPGIGEYTAGAILSISFDKPSVSIDGNVYRVLGRYYKIEESISKRSTYYIYEKYILHILPSNNAGDFTQSFMDLGSLICTPKSPRCEECPLRKGCLSFKSGEVLLYPKKDKKKDKKVVEMTVFLYIYKNKVAIRKRENKGLLASLYEFPNINQIVSEIDIENQLIDENVSYYSVSKIGDAEHIFSHVIWNMTGYKVVLKKPIVDYLWVTKEEICQFYSIPSAFAYFCDSFLNCI